MGDSIDHAETVTECLAENATPHPRGSPRGLARPPQGDGDMSRGLFVILLGLNLAGVLIHATALVANLARGACAEAMASATLLAFSGTAGQRNPARVQRHRCMRALGGMALP